MNEEYTQPDDKEKFNLAVQLLTGYLGKQGMPEPVASIIAYSQVAEAMDATIEQRRRVALRWEMNSAIHLN